MNRLVRWYNQNRKAIWKTIAIVVIIIGVIQLINYYYKVRNEEQLNMANTQIQNTIQNNNNYNSVRVDDDSSSLTGEKISEGQKTEIQVIDDFINFCNEKNLQEAYDLLTEDCKEELYPTLENFEQSYYNNLFTNGKKNVSVENWVNNIYKASIKDDFLSTGKYSKENTIQDYITVIDKDDEYKLNINGYIGEKEINKSKEDENVTIEIENTNAYMDYQIYKIKVTNHTDYTMLLDDGVSIDAMYIEDSNGNKYSAYTHEINSAELKISPRETKEISIKYYSKYGSDKKIDKVVFSRMILNYESYVTYQNKSLYRAYGNYEIEI